MGQIKLIRPGIEGSAFELSHFVFHFTLETDGKLVFMQTMDKVKERPDKIHENQYGSTSCPVDVYI